MKKIQIIMVACDQFDEKCLVKYICKDSKLTIWYFPSRSKIAVGKNNQKVHRL